MTIAKFKCDQIQFYFKNFSELESKDAKVKNLAHEREQLKKINLELRRSPSPNRRSPSPGGGRPNSNYAPSNYAPSIMGSPNGGFYDDDRRSVLGDLTMPTFNPNQKRLSQQFVANGDVTLEMDENSEDELDAINNRQKDKEGNNLRKSPDNISMHSASTTNSEMILLPNTPDNNHHRRPVSQEPGKVDGRGYICNPDMKKNGARSRSPSPTNKRKSSDLSMDNLRKFDNNPGVLLEPARGRARSLMDLRVMALTGEAQKHTGNDNTSNLRKTTSIENILTGQVHRLAPHPYASSNASTSSSGRRQPMGIYAQEQQRQRGMADSAF